LSDKSKLIRDSESWERIQDQSISPNGEYLYYMTYSPNPDRYSLTITSKLGETIHQIANVISAKFSFDSKYLYYKLTNHTLVKLNIRRLSSKLIYNVKDFWLSSDKKKEILVYTTTDDLTLNICSSNLLRKLCYSDVVNCFFSEYNKTIVIQIKDKIKYKLIWLNFSNEKEKLIWSGSSQIEKLSFSKDSHKCAFIEGKNHSLRIYGYEDIKPSSDIIIDSNLSLIRNYDITNSRLQFNMKGDQLFFDIRKRNVKRRNPKIVSVDVWSYKDRLLQPEQANQNNNNDVKNMVYSFERKKTTLLNKDNQILLFGNTSPSKYLMAYTPSTLPEFQETKIGCSFGLVSIENGIYQEVLKDYSRYNYQEISISPDEKFLVWYDSRTLALVSFEIETRRQFTLNSTIPYSLYNESSLKIGRNEPWGICSWKMKDNSLLVYDEFDIWQLSLINSSKIKNLTNGQGRKHKIILKLLLEYTDANKSDKMVISGFQKETKRGGYWKINASGLTTIDTTHLQSYSIETRLPIFYETPISKLIKANNADKFLIIRERADKYPNSYFTIDFLNYYPISNVQPQYGANWLTAELIKWKMLDGNYSQGILYKPQNFDPKKKYPVILNYYEKRSDAIHTFIMPEFSYGQINIPSFVDNGYLIFVPDIYSTPGRNGVGTFNSIESAAQCLSKMEFVDSTKIGLQGHSYGGWQTNYMVTHSTRFAAACEAAGVSDQVSAYGQLSFKDGKDRQVFYERMSQGSPYGYGVTPWTDPSSYINNSPVFKIGNIVTPLLMMHNKDDDSVPFEQAIEFFVNLKRAGKVVWLLQYDGGYGHQLGGNAAQDYHTRMLQFFDYYLKGAPPPIWMTQGIPFQDKYEKTGLEYDKSGNHP